MEREANGEVIRERGPGAGRERVVGGVVGNVDSGAEERVRANRDRGQKPVRTRNGPKWGQK